MLTKTLGKAIITFFLLTLSFGICIQNIKASDLDEYVITSNLTQKASDFDKVLERIGLLVRFNANSKSSYWREIVDKRLMETKIVAEQKNLGTFEETTSRYAAYIGRYSEYLISKKLVDQKDISIKMFNKHIKILEPLRDSYEYDSAWWLLLQQDIDTINIFKNRIGSEL